MQIRCHELSIEFASKPALSGVTFSINSGDFVGIIGPNGSGKTTLLKSLSGILPPKRGSIELDGRSVQEYSPGELALMVGLVPQKSSSEFSFTVKDLVSMGRYSRSKQSKGKANEEKVRWALEELDLIRLADRPVTSLSGGEWQRVLIARALAQEPEIILLDEVTTHLDIKYKLDILDKVFALHRDAGITVVAVLHELELAAKYASKLLVLADGKIHSYGAPEEVLTARTIKEVFGVDFKVVQGARGEIILQPPKPRKASLQPKVQEAPIHIIAGGGSGVEILKTLAENGYSLTMGAINRDDADWVTAKEYQIPMAEEIPFAPLSEGVREINRELMHKAKEIIVADLPFGPGNVSNLEDLLSVITRSQRVYLLNSTPIQDRDFTKGKATRLWKELLASGAKPVASIASLIKEIIREEY